MSKWPMQCDSFILQQVEICIRFVLLLLDTHITDFLAKPIFLYLL